MAAARKDLVVNYAVELLGCAALTPFEQRRVVRRFRLGLAWYLGGARNVPTFLAAFDFAESGDVDRQTSAIAEAARVYTIAHRLATDFAFAGRRRPDGANFEVWQAH